MTVALIVTDMLNRSEHADAQPHLDSVPLTAGAPG
jgi:hypothetical protein